MNTPEASTIGGNPYPHILAPGDPGYALHNKSTAGPELQKVHPVIDSGPQQSSEDLSAVGQLTGVAVMIGGASVGSMLTVIEFARNQPQAGTLAAFGGAIIAATGAAAYRRYHNLSSGKAYKS